MIFSIVHTKTLNFGRPSSSEFITPKLNLKVYCENRLWAQAPKHLKKSSKLGLISQSNPHTHVENSGHGVRSLEEFRDGTGRDDFVP